jgi:hypothetical protein
MIDLTKYNTTATLNGQLNDNSLEGSGIIASDGHTTASTAAKAQTTWWAAQAMTLMSTAR